MSHHVCLRQMKIYSSLLSCFLVPPTLSASSGSVDDIELRNRMQQPKSIERERPRSVSSQTTFDPINTRLSKSNENITQTVSQKTPTFVEQHRTQRVTKSEDRHSSASVTTPLNDLQIQRFNILKDKFERQQPIDTVFGKFNSSNARH